ncbi:Fur family transcriptional regulator [Cyanobacterium aponinum]|uniref:Ferric uptake regulator, Fur family n=1 Tax=Cyanobacterium aponinum (strain PCC 10605) TaxID=755178 RepID=K9Z145_CYAAP|nr:Fur family transcriptional regulator [Cyanobacterium aponinum]AFZ52884.1 ferric uptake regulator, Fur family [Cyanobacterium aponinum PCC 10605]
MKPHGVETKKMRSLKDALNRCQELGLRISRQRRFILELLWEEKNHLCAKEIYEKLSQQGKHIGYTAVYQNLEILSQNGIIECVDKHGSRLYSNLGDEHSHLNIIDTDQIVDIQVELPPDLIKNIEAKTGVKVAHYRIDFYGYKN